MPKINWWQQIQDLNPISVKWVFDEMAFVIDSPSIVLKTKGVEQSLFFLGRATINLFFAFFLISAAYWQLVGLGRDFTVHRRSDQQRHGYAA